MTTSSNTKMPLRPVISLFAIAHKSFGCTFAFESYLDMLSCDKLLFSGATSLKLNAEYLVDVTFKNEQYSSREHFDFDICITTLYCH